MQARFLQKVMRHREGSSLSDATLKVAFMPWKGYNFEDAIVLSERIPPRGISSPLSMWTNT